MEKIRRFAQAVILIGVLLGTGSWGLIAGYAQSTSRVAADSPKSESNTWWLMSWGTQEVLCSIPVNREGVPNLTEVATKCGQDLAYRWLNTPPCEVGRKTVDSYKECEAARSKRISPLKTLPLDTGSRNKNLFDDR